MELTAKQEEGLKISLDRYKHREKYVTISGFAGTGKSTLVSFLIAYLDVSPTKVAYVSFTGKAAEVLRKKGNHNAMTLHRLLYESIPRQGGGFIHVPKKSIPYTVVVVDEVSMVPKSMIDLLLSHNAFVIFLGDSFQLPQINKDDAHDILDHPHIFLDQVMRQAAESEIIQLTMKIRNFENIECQNGSEVMVLPSNKFVSGQLEWADQVICATNNLRNRINDQMREMRGLSGLPQDGEKLICLRNYWDDLSMDGESALVNGMTGVIRNPQRTFRRFPNYLHINPENGVYVIIGDFISDDGKVFEQIAFDEKCLTEGKFSLDWRGSYTLGKMINKIGDLVPKECAFGYAVTCHKAQGSEFSRVLVIEETFPFSKLEHARWLYTACTRAMDKLVLIKEG